MSDQLAGRKVAILAADGVERVELEKPRQAVEDAGASTELLSIHDGEIAARNNDLEDAGTFAVDRLVSDASADDYDALLLPGVTGNPDKLRVNDDAIRFVRQFFESGKPIGTICHGPWSLVEAGVVAGRRITSFPSSGPTCATPGRRSSTRRSSRTRGSYPVADPTTCRRSARRSSRNSPRGGTKRARDDGGRELAGLSCPG